MEVRLQWRERFLSSFGNVQTQTMREQEGWHDRSPAPAIYSSPCGRGNVDEDLSGLESGVRVVTTPTRDKTLGWCYL